MINTIDKNQLSGGVKGYVQSDYFCNFGEIGSTRKYIRALFQIGEKRFTYMFWFRLTKSKNKVVSFIAKLLHLYYSNKYQIQLPTKTKVGYGLYLGHGMCIVVNGGTTIGDNVHLSQFVSIGTNKNTPAVIGDNVYIGPNVSIVEDVNIGDNVTIGAGAVVTKSIPENATAVGCPAKVLNYDNPAIFIGNRIV